MTRKLFTYTPNWGGTTAQGLNDPTQLAMLNKAVTLGLTNVNLAFIAPLARDANFSGPVTVPDSVNGSVAFTDIWSDLQPGRDWSTAPAVQKYLAVENTDSIPGLNKPAPDPSYNIGGLPQPPFAVAANTACPAPIFEGHANSYVGTYGVLKKIADGHPNLKAGISIGGWSRADALKYIAADDKLMSNFINSLKELQSIYGFKAIDLDWEFPGLPGNAAGGYNNWAQNYTTPNQLKSQTAAVPGQDKAGFTKIITKLHDEFPNVDITATVSPNLQAIANIDFNAIKDKVSNILLMGYDIGGIWDGHTSHNAPLYSGPSGNLSIDSAVTAMMAAGLPAEKLVLGVPFYGRAVYSVPDSAVGTNCPKSGNDSSISYSGIKSTILNQPNLAGYTRYWDDVAKVPYLYNATTKEWISYDDTQSLGEKMKYMQDKGLGGVMSWQLYQDSSDLELTTFLANNLNPAKTQLSQAQTQATAQAGEFLSETYYGTDSSGECECEYSVSWN